MKKLLITLSAVLVMVPLTLLAACGGGTKLSDADIRTIQGYATRLDAIEGKTANLTAETVTKLNNLLNDLDTETLDKLAALDADALEALLDLDAETLNKLVALDADELTALLALDLATWKTNVDNRLTALEEDDDTGGGGGNSGDVTVALDLDETPYQFLTNATATNQVLPVRITNGTSDYQQVKFGLIMECITTSSSVAENANITSVLVGTGSPYSVSGVPSFASCQLVYFTWTSTDVILVPPNKEYNLYVYLNGITTTNAEVWQISVTSVITTEL